MNISLHNLKVAIIVNDGFQQVEMTEPRKALELAGAETHLISTNPGIVRGWNHHKWGDEFEVDKTIDEVHVDDYHALLLPGGSKSAGSLRENRDVVNFVRVFVESGKPVAAICHGPWLLESAGVIDGRRITSDAKIADELDKAGATWLDQAVVVDDNLVTSRKPGDIPEFNKRMLETFAALVDLRE